MLDENSAFEAISTSVESSISDVWLTPHELADRWRLDAQTLANQRAEGRGIRSFKTPGGAVRYRLSDVLDAEENGMCGLTWGKLSRCIGSLLDLRGPQHERFMTDLKAALKAA